MQRMQQDEQGRFCNISNDAFGAKYANMEVPNFNAKGAQPSPQSNTLTAQQQRSSPMIWPPNGHINTAYLQSASNLHQPHHSHQQQQPAQQHQHHQQLQQQHHHQPQHQPQKQSLQQPQIYNEYLPYNNMAYAVRSGQPETFSVLPVGHGNFLKVYHCAENLNNTEASCGLFQQNNSSFQKQQPLPPPQPQEQQQPHHQHPAQFYELFASSPLLPKAEMVLATQQLQSQPHLQIDAASANSLNLQNGNGSNMLINNLVNNWSPNLTGGTYTQFGDSTMSDPMQPVQLEATATSFVEEPTANTITAGQYNMHTMSAAVVQSSPQTPVKASNLKVNTATTGNLKGLVSTSLSNNANSVATPLPEVKKRIVAEVKPMRLSYSDVLSKGTERSLPDSGSRSSNNLEVNSAAQCRRQSGLPDDLSAQTSNRSMKRSPTHEPKDAAYGHQQKQQQQSGNNAATVTVSNSNVGVSRNKKRMQGNATNMNQQAVNNQKSQQQTQTQSKQQPQQKPNEIIGKKRLPTTNAQCKNMINIHTGTASTSNIKANEPTITKSANDSSVHTMNTSNSQAAVNMGNTRKANKSSGAGAATNYSNSVNSSSSSSSKRFFNNAASSSSSNSNFNTNSSYSYSSKRSRNSNYNNSNTSLLSASAPNHNYELLKRLMRAWWMYTLKLLTWLFYLVYDIVVLGCSMAYDHLAHAYVAGLAYAKQLRKELKQNSGKPSIWLRNYWRRFDSRFKKNSRWAIWRRFYKKKPPESSSEPFKNGRLPQTGEEAMYSLLNCKGKDAYSILGVPPDSSQEQIRKHYKKIAVLVHPDKNKQAGAEEAFKVLQRAFELVGEPENRLAYDQSLAEALHAEKAWTELHDLLSQLQTKITEAANTIRCSTCAQRHPRKLTDRPHYAARECTSCKIRHSAKEGDIWAETSMMGLRWKYLALMEGKVYDITEWANCQKGALSLLEPNSHVVQYRIVRGAQQQQQQQQQQQAQHSSHHQYGHHHERSGNSGGSASGKYKRDIPTSEASLHEFLDNLYSGQHPGQPNPASFASGGSRRRTRRN